MKKLLLLAVAAVVIFSGSAFAAVTDITDWSTAKGWVDYEGTQAGSATAGKAANGIVWSRHNLSSYGEHYQATTSVIGTATKQGIEPLSVITTEICVFCHTPHFGGTIANGAPLWNRGTSATGYVAYGTTVGGTTIAALTNSTGGSSLACLSCHDGVTTLDNLINAPGKGSRTSGTGADAKWIFGEIGTQDVIGDTTAGGNLDFNLSNKDTGSRLNIGGAAGTGTRSASAVDLSNDHPINMVYNASVASLRATTTTISSISIPNGRMNYGDENNQHGMGAPAPGTGTFGRSDNLWASRGYISSSATIGELLRDTNKVQCASCHDPHYKNQTNNDPVVVCAYLPTIANYNTLTQPIYGGPYVDETNTPSREGCYVAATGLANASVSGSLPYADYISDVDSDGLFLRRVGGNSNSGVCRTCHNK